MSVEPEIIQNGPGARVQRPVAVSALWAVLAPLRCGGRVDYRIVTIYDIDIENESTNNINAASE